MIGAENVHFQTSDVQAGDPEKLKYLHSGRHGYPKSGRARFVPRSPRWMSGPVLGAYSLMRRRASGHTLTINDASSK